MVSGDNLGDRPGRHDLEFRIPANPDERTVEVLLLTRSEVTKAEVSHG
jgi:hypothetical protein